MRLLSYTLTATWLLLLAGCSSFSERYVANRPELDPKTREAILQHRVILGMFPDEAIAATYGHRQPYVSIVKPDAARWPEGSDTQRVIWSERTHPDDSEIKLNFWTRTQFNTTNLVGFQVKFSHGRATSITRFPPPPETRLTRDEATRIAKQMALNHGYRLADYLKPTADYGFLREGAWMAFFECKAPIQGDDFSVWIDDRTGIAHIESCK